MVPFSRYCWRLLELRAQDKTDLQQILQRLDRLEEENHKLADEVHALRMEFAAAKGVGQPAESPPAQAQVQTAELGSGGATA